jgi:hypothetical protein
VGGEEHGRRRLTIFAEMQNQSIRNNEPQNGIDRYLENRMSFFEHGQTAS